MTTFSPAAIDQVKAAADILDVAARYVQLRKIATHEHAGPCPKCGGRDRFHVNTKTQRWMCSYCTGRETWQDVIDLRRFITGERFPVAVEALGGRIATLPAPIAPRQPAPPEPSKWTTDDWQQRARRTMIAAAVRLDSAAGDAGRAYLEQRGISMRTAHHWLLGYAAVSPPTVDGRRIGGPSLTMPYLRHDDDRLMALRYRRIGASGTGDRYINEPGSDVRLFGLHLLDLSAATLVLVEGELNAISIWQAADGMRLCVLSIGGQSLKQQALRNVASASRQFVRCVVWCDESEKTQQLRAVVESSSVQMRRSPVVDGQKVDANDMLQRGQLGPFLARILEP